MGIDVQLRGEDGKVLEEVPDSDGVLERASQWHFADTRLLRYVVPWGDAMFNQAQAADLADDIAAVCRRDPGAPLSVRLGIVQALVDRLAAGPHVYVWFVGD